MDDSNRWKACDRSDWIGIPLGLTSEQSAESLYLVIDTEIQEVPVSKKRRNSDI